QLSVVSRQPSVFSRSHALTLSLPPAAAKFAGGFGPAGKLELETCREQSAGDDAAAFEHQFGFGSDDSRSELQHPICSRQAEARTPGLAKSAHEFGVGQRVRRGK